MGIDPAHMSYERLAQAIPPVYEQLVFAQACMAACRRDYGVPTVTFDEMLLDPDTVRGTLRWLGLKIACDRVPCVEGSRSAFSRARAFVECDPMVRCALAMHAGVSHLCSTT